jgi:hypothetical protein
MFGDSYHQFKYETLIREMDKLVMSGFPLIQTKSKCLSPVVEAFAANIIRTAHFVITPAQISGFLIAEDTKGDVDSLTLGIRYIETMLESRAMQWSVDAVFSAVVLESWTAFECLAGDVWVAAVDNGPKEVASRVALSKHLQKPDDQITWETVLQLEYDPRKTYGSWLREVGKVSFSKLDYIRLFYTEAFGKETQRFFDEVEGGYIFALSAYRNALTHNAGRADKHFIKRVERFPELRSIVLNDQLLLEGELVTKLHHSAVGLGRKLVEFVDSVISDADAGS